VEKLLFYIFSVILIFAAFRVVTARNPVPCALYLVLAFLTSPAVWLLLEAEFLAIVLVLVYVGAVMVLFLFVVMMLDINLAPLREGFASYLPVGILVAFLMLFQLTALVGAKHFGLNVNPAPARHGADYSNTEEIGNVLYTVYVYPFEIAAVILLVAIIAAIALTMRRRVGTRFQQPSQQVATRREDRLRIIKMPPEKKR